MNVSNIKKKYRKDLLEIQLEYLDSFTFLRFIIHNKFLQKKYFINIELYKLLNKYKSFIKKICKVLDYKHLFKNEISNFLLNHLDKIYFLFTDDNFFENNLNGKNLLAIKRMEKNSYLIITKNINYILKYNKENDNLPPKKILISYRFEKEKINLFHLNILQINEKFFIMYDNHKIYIIFKYFEKIKFIFKEKNKILCIKKYSENSFFTSCSSNDYKNFKHLYIINFNSYKIKEINFPGIEQIKFNLKNNEISLYVKCLSKEYDENFYLKINEFYYLIYYKNSFLIYNKKDDKIEVKIYSIEIDNMYKLGNTIMIEKFNRNKEKFYYKTLSGNIEYLTKYLKFTKEDNCIKYRIYPY